MNKLVAALSLVIILTVLALAAVDLHPLGNPAHTEMDTYFLNNAQTELGANSVVAAIVFDYRGFDTLGEATVLFTAVTGVLMVFWGRVK
ncbi:MAG: hypothetical protein J7L23_05550 [Candidatus Diapherotrites archaeon]|nr:hypothetical protein [Candidatus Diapherotrites archaeon]